MSVLPPVHGSFAASPANAWRPFPTAAAAGHAAAAAAAGGYFAAANGHVAAAAPPAAFGGWRPPAMGHLPPGALLPPQPGPPPPGAPGGPQMPQLEVANLQISALMDLYQQQLVELSAAHSMLLADQERLAALLAPFVDGEGRQLMPLDDNLLFIKKGLDLRLLEFEEDCRRIQKTEKRLQRHLDDLSLGYDAMVLESQGFAESKLMGQVKDLRKIVNLLQFELDELRFQRDVYADEAKRLRGVCRYGSWVQDGLASPLTPRKLSPRTLHQNYSGSAVQQRACCLRAKAIVGRAEARGSKTVEAPRTQKGWEGSRGPQSSAKEEESSEETPTASLPVWTRILSGFLPSSKEAPKEVVKEHAKTTYRKSDAQWTRIGDRDRDRDRDRYVDRDRDRYSDGDRDRYRDRGEDNGRHRYSDGDKDRYREGDRDGDRDRDRDREKSAAANGLRRKSGAGPRPDEEAPRDNRRGPSLLPSYVLQRAPEQGKEETVSVSKEKAAKSPPSPLSRTHSFDFAFPGSFALHARKPSRGDDSGSEGSPGASRISLFSSGSSDTSDEEKGMRPRASKDASRLPARHASNDAERLEGSPKGGSVLGSANPSELLLGRISRLGSRTVPSPQASSPLHSSRPLSEAKAQALPSATLPSRQASMAFLGSVEREPNGDRNRDSLSRSREAPKQETRARSVSGSPSRASINQGGGPSRHLLSPRTREWAPPNLQGRQNNSSKHISSSNAYSWENSSNVSEENEKWKPLSDSRTFRVSSLDLSKLDCPN